MPYTKKYLVWLVSLVCLVLVSSGFQTPENPRFSIEFLGLEQGFNARKITDVLVDHTGLVWIGTGMGLFCYDGVRLQSIHSGQFTGIEIPEIRINSIACDDENNLWAATSSGIYLLSTRETVPIDPVKLGIPKRLLTCINCQVESHPSGGVFFLHQDTVFLYQQRQTLPYAVLPEGKGVEIEKMRYSDQASTLYFLRRRTKFDLFALVNGQFQNLNLPLANAVLKDTTNLSLHDCQLLGFNQDSVWITGRYFMAPPGGSRLKYLADRQQILYQDETETLSTLLPACGAAIEYLFQDMPFLEGSIKWHAVPRCIATDEHQTSYIATDIGLFVVRPKWRQPFEIVPGTQGKSARGLAVDQFGHIISGTYDGLVVSDLKTGVFQSGRDILNPRVIAPLGPGRFWILGEQDSFLTEICIDSSGRFSLPATQTAINTGFAFDMTDIPGGYYGYGGNKALFRVSKHSGAVRSYPLPPFDFPDLPRVIRYTPETQLWVGTVDGLKLLQLDAATKVFLADQTGLLPPELRKFGLTITSLYPDRNGYIWVGTQENGLYRLHRKNLEITHFRQEDGLPSNSLYSILGSHGDSVLWIGALKGLCRMEVFSGLISNYSRENGLMSNEFNSGSALEADSLLFMSGIGGVHYFNPREIKPLKPNYSPVAVLVLSGKDGVPSNVLVPTDGEQVRVSAHSRSLQLYFRSNAPALGKQMVYRYSMNPKEDRWTQLAAKEILNLVGLPHGKHTVYYQVRHFSGTWSQTRYFTIRVLPLWFQRWEVRIGALLAVIGFAYYFIRLRTRQFKMDLDIRRRISEDLHDEIGNRVYSLRTMAGRLTSSNLPEVERRDLVDHFDLLSQRTLERIRDFIWASNPRNDSLSSLVTRMEDYVFSAVRPIVPNTIFTVEPFPENKKFPGLTKSSFILIFQELLTNIVKHTHAENIQIRVATDKKNLTVEIVNQHKGLKQSAGDRFSTGLESMENRLKHGGLSLEFLENEATQWWKMTASLK